MRIVSMVIRDDVKGDCRGSAIVELSGDEIIYLNNILYSNTKQMTEKTTPLELAKDVRLLNAIVQHGGIDSFDIGSLAEINERIEKRVK